MEIALFFPSFNVGGAEKVMILLANQFVSSHYKVTVIAKNKGTLRNLLDERVRVIDIGMRRIRNTFFFLKRVLNNNDFDCLVSSTDFCNFLSIIARSFFARKMRLIVIHHNFFNAEIRNLGVYGRFSPCLMKRLYKKADFVVAVSDGIKDMLLDLNIPVSKVVRIYNPIDIGSILEKSKASDVNRCQDKYIIYVGRLEVVKNVSLLIKAYQLLVKRNCDYNLVIVGDGSMKKTLEMEVEKMNLTSRVLFLGNTDNPYPYIKSASLLILPSTSESFGIVVVEAFALGVPVVSTPTIGVKDVDKKKGLVHFTESFEDECELSCLIHAVLERPCNREALKAHALLFDYSRIMGDYISLIEGKDIN